MDLIVKPTVKCNFKCTFCSSTKLSEDDNEIVTISEIERFIKRFPGTRTIIINGGDPLMMEPDYYWSMIDVLERNNSSAVISFTTNLWAFYKKPEKWTELFKSPYVQVSTSFQYGNSRLKGDLTPFSEEEFLKVSDLMLERVGYRPSFIAVITSENRDSAIKTAELAKRLGVEAKVNYAVASGEKKFYKGVTIGNEDSMFVQADMYELYLEIYEAGLAEFEYSTKQMINILRNGVTTCPLSRECDAGIRSLQPGNGYYSCGAFGDDRLYPIDFEAEMSGEFIRPLSGRVELLSMKDACLTCPMFSICNGCKKTIHDTKRLGLVEYHCKKMKSLAPRIIEANGMTGILEPTPYVDESLIYRG